MYLLQKSWLSCFLLHALHKGDSGGHLIGYLVCAQHIHLKSDIKSCNRRVYEWKIESVEIEWQNVLVTFLY